MKRATRGAALRRGAARSDMPREVNAKVRVERRCCISSVEADIKARRLTLPAPNRSRRRSSLSHVYVAVEVAAGRQSQPAGWTPVGPLLPFRPARFPERQPAACWRRGSW